MLNKTPLLHKSLGPRVFLSFFLSLSLSLRLILWSAEARWAHFLAQLLRTSWEGSQCLHPFKKVPGAYMKQCKPRVKGFIGFLHKPRNISLSLSLFYFLIVNSRPPGYGPLKDLNKWRPEQGPGTRGRFGWSDSKGLLRSLSTKTWVKWLESPITFLLYFITSL